MHAKVTFWNRNYWSLCLALQKMLLGCLRYLCFLFVCVCFSLGVWFTLCYFVYDTKHALCTEFADLFKRCLLLVLLEDFACMIFSLVFKILKKCLRK